MNALTVADLQVLGAEPRIRDLRLAGALGFENPVNIRKLIRANENELRRYGEFFSEAEKNTDPMGRGRPGVCYLLTQGQALLLCMFSRAPKAPDVRQQLIEVYIAWRQGHVFLQTDAKPSPESQVCATVAQTSSIEATIAQHEALCEVRPQIAADRLKLAHDLGSVNRVPKEKFFADDEVRRLLVSMHGKATVPETREICRERYGAARTPSKSAVYRFWRRLDSLRRLERAS